MKNKDKRWDSVWGWRGRIGVLLPPRNLVMETDLFRLASTIEGISFHYNRIVRTSNENSQKVILEMSNNTANAALLFQDCVDIFLYGCTAGSFLGGVKFEEEIRKKVYDLTGIKCITTSQAAVEALKYLNVKKITFISPYTNDINIQAKQFIESFGFEVVAMAGMGFNTSNDNSSTQPQDIYRFARNAVTGSEDAILISCTNFSSLPIIETLEKDIGKYVVTSNQSSFWFALKSLGIPSRVQGYGKLLQEKYNINDNT